LHICAAAAAAAAAAAGDCLLLGQPQHTVVHRSSGGRISNS
jgi:hypothetical protein